MRSNKGEFADFDDDDMDIVDRIWDGPSADSVRSLKPAKLDTDGRINLDGPATRTFVAELVERLKAGFGITYRGKPDA